VCRLLRQDGLAATTTRRRRYDSGRGDISLAPKNIINQGFYAAAPNQKWLTDLAEFHIPAGKVHLSPVIDFFDGLVVNWSIGTRPDAELVDTMLDSAIESVAGCEERSVVHSDRGAHYRCPGSLLRMQAAKLTRSMSRKGYSPDNTACGGFFGRQKRSCSIFAIGKLRPSISSSRSLTRSSAGTTENGSRSRSAPLGPPNTGELMESRHKTVQEFCPPDSKLRMTTASG
jgi:transposase InsO family protein